MESEQRNHYCLVYKPTGFKADGSFHRIRLKCAILGLGVLKVALHKAKGTPLPEEWQGLGDDLSFE